MQVDGHHLRYPAHHGIAAGETPAVEAAIADRIQAHYNAGASHVCIQPIDPETRGEPDWRLLEALSPITSEQTNP